MINSVFRAFRYGLDEPALKGRDLAPQGTITGREPQGSNGWRACLIEQTWRWSEDILRRPGGSVPG
jgi:hypothetical protein